MGSPVSMRNCSDSVTRAVTDAYVVDTGVFLRWFIDQDGFEHARDLQQKLVDGSVAVETVTSLGSRSLESWSCRS